MISSSVGSRSSSPDGWVRPHGEISWLSRGPMLESHHVSVWMPTLLSLRNFVTPSGPEEMNYRAVVGERPKVGRGSAGRKESPK